jgi:hypothetical protein
VLSAGETVAVGDGAQVKVWDLSRARRHLDFERQIDAARQVLRAKPDDPAALATLAKWYAFRGVDDWAERLLEDAIAGGAAVSPLLSARCHWMRNHFQDATREYDRARAIAAAPATYLDLCRDATSLPSTRPAAAQPAQ